MYSFLCIGVAFFSLPVAIFAPKRKHLILALELLVWSVFSSFGERLRQELVVDVWWHVDYFFYFSSFYSRMNSWQFFHLCILIFFLFALFPLCNMQLSYLAISLTFPLPS